MAVERFSRRGVMGAALACLVAPARAAAGAGVLLVPGYRAFEARSRGRYLIDQPGVDRSPADWDGPVTLLSRYDLDDPGRPPMRAAYPLNGHGLCPVAGHGLAVFVGMRQPQAITLDLATLALVATAEPLEPGATFGGHAALLPDGIHVLVAERPGEGEGWLSVREAATLRAIGRIPSFGLRPHDVRITTDGRHAVVANYGSVTDPTFGAALDIPRVLAPCLAVIDVASGSLETRIDGVDPTAEVRHLLAPRRDRIFAVTTHVASQAEVIAALGDGAAEPGVDAGTGYLPALPLRVEGDRAEAMLDEQRTLARHGLSLGWDALRDEVLLTFPTTDRIAIVHADGRLRAMVDTAALGLRNPSGVALAHDGQSWLVTGHEAGLLELDCASLEPRRVTAEPTWWGHSHTVLV